MRRAGRGGAVTVAVDQAGAAVAVLEPDVTGQVLHRLVVAIDHCRQAGLVDSSWLEAARRAVAAALWIDLRWM